MPTEGIHSVLVTNWKSERLESKCAIRCSDRTNVTIAITRENMRIARKFFRLKKSSRMAPSVGTNVTIDRIEEFNASISLRYLRNQATIRTPPKRSQPAYVRT